MTYRVQASGQRRLPKRIEIHYQTLGIRGVCRVLDAVAEKARHLDVKNLHMGSCSYHPVWEDLDFNALISTHHAQPAR
ncbi:MAG: hypothetical protein E6J33_04905 [Chloroflexi bacterium]|nr:MAG: hypothetical protein E6J33_04905 [Chloroflexota bacterium]